MKVGKTSGHPNASILMEIAKEAAVNPEPWDEFEYKAYDGSWQQMTRKCTMNCFDEIRRKPRTIRIGNYDVPEPMRYEPKKGDVYYLVAPIDHAVKRYEWEGDSKEFKWLDCGFMQETKEGAELMLKALQELLGKK